MTIGERIKKLREEKGLNQVQLAEAIGLTKQAISKFEKDMLLPSAHALKALAETLHCTADYILGIA